MNKVITSVLSTGLLCGLLSVSQALTQFAVLNPVPTPPGPTLPYQFDNATQTFGVVPVVLDVKFAFLQPVPVIGTNNIDAKLTISAVATTGMAGTQQDLEGLMFTVTPTNAGDVFGAGILLQTIVPNPVDFPAGTLASLFSVGSNAFLTSEFGIGLLMSSSYLVIDSTQDQRATWSFANSNPAGGFAAGANGFLRDTQLNGNANFSATVRNIVPEPGSVAMLIGFGVSGSLALLRRRRK